ncbi:hypothetical protein TanjilG_29484 [Lupinus angustifolius]|uniref:Acid phosphatase n=1 Tax=Lupinus angustifolius TaxID=3871 RepID=A0A4P1R5N5_LUPAN|nr:PREDICTED: uncharacterized protein At2g39920 [Lupinus angustifolius]XP_019460879.1 PREDICTED: uncharacterized protein At2g39920 [Lupinus angustifolius]XP_019460880.1 PREDICTED: uncharacterized protein At2g39920 [Lupinus angustifolius]OIW02708.1 hypothetical protein TanjilG_29484 [Lupinus angustifolius]
MSAYGHQMEQMYSARSLSGGSEIRSNYTMESGFHIPSLAATILVSALVAVGVLLTTLLISLAIMLQSCQSRNAGVVNLPNTNDYSYCKVYSLHAELNNLEGYQIPEICRDLAVQYIKAGQYGRDLDLVKYMVEDYFNSSRPSDDGLDVVLIDIDGIFPPNAPSFNLFQRFQNDSISNCILEANNLKCMFVLRLYMNLQAGGWPIILLSRESEIHKNGTINHLVSAGFRGWSALMMRAEDEDPTKENKGIFKLRNVIQAKGFRIKSIISSHIDTLSVADTGIRNFFLPAPICDKFEQQRTA